MVLPSLTSAGYLWPCGPDGKGNACAAGFLAAGTQANPIASSTSNRKFFQLNRRSVHHGDPSPLYQINLSANWICREVV
jgi:hypothetical protein